MRAGVFFIFVALSCCSFAFAFNSWGSKGKNNTLIRNVTVQSYFNEDKSKFVHINNCHEYPYEITRIEISTHHGNTVKALLLEGGPGHSSALIEMTGVRNVTVVLRVWGVYPEDPCKKDIRIYDEKWTCGEVEPSY